MESSIGEVVLLAYGIGVDVTIGVVTFRLDKLKAGKPGGICGTTGT
jgi:hypothetical protein